MVSRMLEYRAMLYRKYELPVCQYVLFLSDAWPAIPEQAASRILERLIQTSPDPLELSRHLQQLRILANLRRLSPLLRQIMELITKYSKEEDEPISSRKVNK